MTQDEFRTLPFAEARAKLLEEMGLLNVGNRFIYRDGTPAKEPATWPLRFGLGREG